jgi:nicotinate dehydrogenase subunit B
VTSLPWDYQAFSTGHSTRPTTLTIPAFWASELLSPGVRLPPAGDPPFATGGGIGRNAVPGYRTASITAQGYRSQDMPIRTSALRSLGAHLNVFATESHMDDLADLVGIDPIDFRTSNLDDLRGIDVLNRVRQLSSWDTYAVSESTGLGVGYARYKNKGAWCAVVAEVEVETSVVVRNLWIAADVGQVINLDGVLNQIEGGAIQSLSWTLKERVRIEGGKVTSDNWEDYPIIRFTEVPPIHIEILDQPDQQSLGSGEAAMGPTAAAVGNAIARILGIRIRDLPIDPANILKTIG